MSRRRVLLQAALGAAMLCVAPKDAAQPFMGQTVPVQGQLISRNQGPVPGLTVFLLHPLLGRSMPSITDQYGRFGWVAIPLRPEAYFLEIYWGPNLVYRQAIQVMQPLTIAPIFL